MRPVSRLGGRQRRIAVHIAVLRRGFAAHHRSGLLGAHAFERFKRLAHEFGDGAVLFGNRFLKPDGIDGHGHLPHPCVHGERHTCHHQADAQVVCRTHRGAFMLLEFHPVMPAFAVPAFRHHRGARRGEGDCHVAVMQVRAEINVEPEGQTHAAQQQGQRLAVHPFGPRGILGARHRTPCRVGKIMGRLLGGIPRDAHHGVQRGDTIVMQRIQRRAVVAAQGDKRGIIEQRHIKLRRLCAGDIVFDRLLSDSRVAFQHRADGGETVEPAFNHQGCKRRREFKRGIPAEEIAPRET